MFVLSFGQIDDVSSHTTKGCSGIGEVLGLHRAHRAYRLVIVEEVKVTVECSAHLRQIGHDIGKFREVDIVGRDGDVVDAVNGFA